MRIGLALGSRSRPTRCSTGRTTSIPTCRRTTRSASTTFPCASAAGSTIEVDGERRTIGITRVHMEEDTGKTSHVGAGGRIGQADYALVDYNRAGVPLVECVSEPDMRSAEEARAYFTRAARDARGARRLGRADGGGVAPLRREHLDAARGRDRARHQGRDQEPELGALARTRAALRGGAAARPRSSTASRSSRRRGTSTRRRARRTRCVRRRRRSTTGTSPSPTSRRSSPTARGSRGSRPSCPSSRPRAATGTSPSSASGPSRPGSSRARPRRPRSSRRPSRSAPIPHPPRTGSRRTSPGS